MSINSVSFGLKISLLFLPSSLVLRLSRCRTWGLELTSGNDQERETGLFRLVPIGKGQVVVGHWALRSLRAMIRNRQVVTRGLYQVPCQLKFTAGRIVLIRPCQAKVLYCTSVASSC